MAKPTLDFSAEIARLEQLSLDFFARNGGGYIRLRRRGD